jgi:hypothetical protein
MVRHLYRIRIATARDLDPRGARAWMIDGDPCPVNLPICRNVNELRLPQALFVLSPEGETRIVTVPRGNLRRQSVHTFGTTITQIDDSPKCPSMIRRNN